MKLVSIVVPCYNEEKVLPLFYAEITKVMSQMQEKYPELEFLNREDDMGEPGLRKAKESYQPTLLLEKCTADLQGGF